MSHFTDTRFWSTAKPKLYESDKKNLTGVQATPPTANAGIQALRRQLQQLNAWPDAGDTFLELLEQAQGYGSTLVPGDYDWLAEVADSVYRGEDIGQRYPSIFQKLLTNADFRQKFLQTLQIRSMGI